MRAICPWSIKRFLPIAFAAIWRSMPPIMQSGKSGKPLKTFQPVRRRRVSMPAPIAIETPTIARCHASESMESLMTVWKPAAGREDFK